MRICIIGYDSWNLSISKRVKDKRLSLVNWLYFTLGIIVNGYERVFLSCPGLNQEIKEIVNSYSNINIWNQKYYPFNQEQEYSLFCESKKSLVRDCDIFLFLKDASGQPLCKEDEELERIIKNSGKTIIYY